MATTHIPTPGELKTRLEDLRVRAHLGGMDARDKLEALRRDITAFGRKAAGASRRGAERLAKRLEELEGLLIRD